MIYFSYIILLIVLLLDLIFYTPVYIHFYYDKKALYVSLYSFFIIRIDKTNKINKLKNKIEISKIKNADKDKLKLIESIKISKILISVPKEKTYEYSYIFNSLYYINDLTDKIDYKIEDNLKVYFKVELKGISIIKKLVEIRRVKNERTSN